MALNKRERAALKKMFTDSKKEMAGGLDLPDGVYAFKILKKGTKFVMTGKFRFETAVEVTGGDEDYIGIKGVVSDNLESAQNWAWFRRKLERLHIKNVSVESLESGELAESMAGRTFEGQVKEKDGFVNLYVNKLVGDGVSSNDDDDDEVSKEIEVGSEVSVSDEEGDWGGEVVSIDEEAETITVLYAEDGEEYEVDASDVFLEEDVQDENQEDLDDSEGEEESDDDDDEDEDAEEDDNEGELTFPENVSASKRMSKSNAQELLEALEVDPTSNPKAIVALMVRGYDGDEEIAIKDLRLVAKALGLDTKGVSKGDLLNEVQSTTSELLS